MDGDTDPAEQHSLDGDTEPAGNRKQHLMDEEDTHHKENRKEQKSFDGDAEQKESRKEQKSLDGDAQQAENRKHSLDDDIENGENKQICFQISHHDNKPSDPTKEYPDFQYLDEIAWINILSYLDDKDRVAVGRTCARLDALLGDKRLQRRHLIVAIGKDMHIEHKFTYTMIVEECSALRFCRKSVRDLTIWLCDLQRVELDGFDLYYLKSGKFKEFRLKTITINTCARHACVYSDDKTPTMVSQMCELLNGLVQGEHASQVESFHFDSNQHTWFDQNCPAFLRILQSTAFTTSLQKLALIEMCSCDLCLCSYGAILGRFQNLQHLTVDAKLMIRIMDSLCNADRKPLLQLHIIVVESDDLLVGYDWDPVSLWQKFLEFNPSVEVHLTVSGPALDPNSDSEFNEYHYLQEAFPANVVPLVSLTVNWTTVWRDDELLLYVSDDDISHLSGVVKGFGQTIQSLMLSEVRFESKDRPLSRLLDSVQATSLKKVLVGYCSGYSEYEVVCEELTHKERFPHLTITHFKCSCCLCVPRNGCGRSKPRGSMDFYSS